MQSLNGLKKALEAAFDATGPAEVEIPADKIYPSPWTHIFLPTVRGEPQVPMLEMPD